MLPYKIQPYTPSEPRKRGPLSSGMTATGSHVDSYSLRGAQPPTRREAYALPLLRMEFERAGHAAAPTRKIEGAYRPSSVLADAEPVSPPGEAFTQKYGAGCSGEAYAPLYSEICKENPKRFDFL